MESQIISAAPYERVTHFTSRITATFDARKTHIGCTILRDGSSANSTKYHCPLATDVSHYGFHYCIGGLHQCGEAADFEQFDLHCDNVKINGRPFDGVFEGTLDWDARLIHYALATPIPEPTPIAPLLYGRHPESVVVFRDLIMPYIMRGISGEGDAAQLVAVQALRSTCRGFFYNHVLARRFNRLYVRTRPGKWNTPVRLRVLDDCSTLPARPACNLRNGTMGTYVMVVGSKAVRYRHTNFICDFVDLIGVLSLRAKNREPVTFSVLIPIKPRGLHPRRGYFFGAWTIGTSEKQFEARGWYPQKCMQWLTRIAIAFEHCGHGYNGDEPFYALAVRTAFKEGNPNPLSPSVIAPQGNVFDDGMADLEARVGKQPNTADNDPLHHGPRETSHSLQEQPLPSAPNVKKLLWAALITAAGLLAFT